MAFNWQTFRTRALTAVVFVGVMLLGMGWNQWSFFLLFSFIHMGCWLEYGKLAEKIYNTIIPPFIKTGWMVLGYGLMLYCTGPFFHFSDYSLRDNLALPVSAAGFVLLLMGIFQKGALHLKAFRMLALGVLYLSLSLGLLVSLYGKGINVAELYLSSRYYLLFLPAFIIACMWINDTMAYIVGSLIGRTPLTPISPKKTWEGTAGGILLAACIAGFIAYRLDSPALMDLSLAGWILLAALVSIAGTLGDLLESKLKRMAGVKDSGQLMPGHGGFLDRFDSLLLATPVAGAFVQLMIK